VCSDDAYELKPHRPRFAAPERPPIADRLHELLYQHLHLLIGFLSAPRANRGRGERGAGARAEDSGGRCTRAVVQGRLDRRRTATDGLFRDDELTLR